MDMIAAAIQLVAGSPNQFIAHALFAILVLSIHIRPARPILHILADQIMIATAVAATIIITAADFTSHLVDDGANCL
jgi:hypothetical protein